MEEQSILKTEIGITDPGEAPKWSVLGRFVHGLTPRPKLALMNTPFSDGQIEEIKHLAEENGFGLKELYQGIDYPPDILADCEILCGYFPKRLLKEAKSLKWLQLPSAGADYYVNPAIYPQRITLTNSSGAFGVAIAEQLVMGALMLLRRMPEYAAQQREKVWKRVGPIRFLRGSIVTVLGTGDVGGSFAELCCGMGAKVYGVCRSGKTGGDHFDRLYPVEDFHEAVAEADVVAACLPLTPETEGLIDRSVFAAMKPGAVFLNVGRGKTVAQQALIEALQRGHLAGAMLDVAEVEPMPEDCPLWEMENVIITPHMSGSDEDAANSAEIFRIFTENLKRYFSGEPLENVVDQEKGY